MTPSLHFYFSLRKSKTMSCHSLSLLSCLHHHSFPFTRNWNSAYIMWSGLEVMNWNYDVKCFLRNRLHCYRPHPFLAAPLVVKASTSSSWTITHSTWNKRNTIIINILAISLFLPDLSYMHCGVCAHYLEWCLIHQSDIVDSYCKGQ
jgi:hypothetical protein